MNASASEASNGAAAAKRGKTEYTKVTMEDGRQVEFPYNAETGKGRQLQKESLIPGENGYTGHAAVRLDFVNGQTRTYVIPGAEYMQDFLADNDFGPRARFLLKHACHGAEQKLGDELAYTPKTGESPPSIDDKVVWIDELIERLKGLEWGTEREANPLAGASNLIKALMELSGKSRAEINDWLKPMSREERAGLKLAPAVKSIIERLEAEALKAKGVDVSGKLAALTASA